jgi:hypothetical protein
LLLWFWYYPHLIDWYCWKFVILEGLTFFLFFFFFFKSLIISCVSKIYCKDLMYPFWLISIAGNLWYQKILDSFF